MSTPANEPPKGRIKQIRQAYTITKKTDTNIGFILALWFLVVGAIFAVISYFIFVNLASFLGIASAIVFGVLSGSLAALIVFGRRAERAAYAQVEGQVGAAAGALQMLKRGWTVQPAVGFTKNQDLVHRVVGRPGIVLVGEGNPTRVRNLLAVEKKKHARIAGDVPILDVVVGNDEGEVKLTKLVRHIQKLPKNAKPSDITSLMSKIKALDAMRPQAPIPRGPMPTSSKGARKMMQGR
ncbi:DUF4191 domain-containing protein [soil metagenome]